MESKILFNCTKILMNFYAENVFMSSPLKSRNKAPPAPKHKLPPVPFLVPFPCFQMEFLF